MSNYFWNREDNSYPKATDIVAWSNWFENIENRRVKVSKAGHGFSVSTVFLGIDHGWNEEEPLLFESMVFNDDIKMCDDLKLDYDYQKRYRTCEEAIEGHHEILSNLEKKWGKYVDSN